MRYTIKDLFVATALIAVGVGGLCAVFRYAENRLSPPLSGFRVWIVWGVWCVSGTFMGVGMFFPFGRIWQGALWGFALVNVFLLAMVAYRLS